MNINILYSRCISRVFYTYDELYYEDFTIATREFLLSELDFYREASQLLMLLRCNRVHTKP